MKRFLSILTVLCLFLFLTPSVQADPWSFELYELVFNINGSVWDNFAPVPPDPWPAPPAGVDLSGFDTLTGIGVLKISVSSVGANFVGVMFDHEIVNPTVSVGFGQNRGAAVGSPGAGLTWEIDEPGFSNPTGYTGDIWTHVTADPLALDNKVLDNGAATYGDVQDIAMALGYNFALADTETAVITMTVTNTDPGSGFRLHQWGGDQEANLWLTSTLSITGDGVIPEPWQMLPLAMMMTGLTATVYWRRRPKQ